MYNISLWEYVSSIKVNLCFKKTKTLIIIEWISQSSNRSFKRGVFLNLYSITLYKHGWISIFCKYTHKQAYTTATFNYKRIEDKLCTNRVFLNKNCAELLVYRTNKGKQTTKHHQKQTTTTTTRPHLCSYLIDNSSILINTVHTFLYIQMYLLLFF